MLPVPMVPASAEEFMVFSHKNRQNPQEASAQRRSLLFLDQFCFSCFTAASQQASSRPGVKEVLDAS
jgi:hypothetical protein